MFLSQYNPIHYVKQVQLVQHMKIHENIKPQLFSQRMKIKYTNKICVCNAFSINKNYFKDPSFHVCMEACDTRRQSMRIPRKRVYDVIFWKENWWWQFHKFIYYINYFTRWVFWISYIKKKYHKRSKKPVINVIVKCNYVHNQCIVELHTWILNLNKFQRLTFNPFKSLGISIWIKSNYNY